MILPIVGYGSKVLREQTKEIDKDYQGLEELIKNMFDTMYSANGVGLAAPQIDLSIRLFVVDADPFKETYPEGEGFKKVFINPQILETKGEIWSDFQEGCLSLPDIHEQVARPSIIVMRYFDENFVEHTEEFDGIRARVIQHEYDHLEGKVFTDRLSPLRRTLLKRKLSDIASGKVIADYKMKRPGTKRK